MNSNDKKSRVGIQETIKLIRKHPQSERVETLTDKQIHDVINLLWDSITETLKEGDKEVAFLGSFTFTTRGVEAKQARTEKVFGKDKKFEASPAHKQIKVRVSSKLNKRFGEETSK